MGRRSAGEKIYEGFLNPESYKYTEKVLAFISGIPSFIQVSV